MSSNSAINIAIVGLGGQGVITLAQLLASYYNMEKRTVCFNEMHGLSQRGGSVASYLRVDGDTSPVFLGADANFVIGLEQMETLRYLYLSKSHPIVIMTNRYEIRNTVYFGLETFPPQKELEGEIRKCAKKVLIFDAIGFENHVPFRIKPTNVAIFGALLQIPEFQLNPEIALKTVDENFKKNIMAHGFNIQAFKEGANWLV